MRTRFAASRGAGDDLHGRCDRSRLRIGAALATTTTLGLRDVAEHDVEVLAATREGHLLALLTVSASAHAVFPLSERLTALLQVRCHGFSGDRCTCMRGAPTPVSRCFHWRIRPGSACVQPSAGRADRREPRTHHGNAVNDPVAARIRIPSRRMTDGESHSRLSIRASSESGAGAGFARGRSTGGSTRFGSRLGSGVGARRSRGRAIGTAGSAGNGECS